MCSGSMRSSISVVSISGGVRALRMANTSGVIASAEGPSPSAGRMKVMCRISEHRDLDMGQARRRRYGGGIGPVHEVQQRAVDRRAPGVDDGRERMARRETRE